MAFKEGVAVHCACFQILFERVKNLHFSEILNENVQRISLTIIAFLKQFKIENKFLPHFKNMPFGLNNASKLSECVCAQWWTDDLSRVYSGLSPGACLGRNHHPP